MELSPRKVWEDFQNKNINKNSAINSIINIIDNSNNNEIRVDSINLLEKIGIFNDNIFKFLENLLISDLNGEIRNTAARFIKNRFQDEALSPMKWAIKYETDYYCIITIIKTLVKINNEAARLILIDLIKDIRKTKYLEKDKNIDNKKFKKSLKKLFKIKKIENITNKDLADIIINYKTISAMIKKFFSVFFELDNTARVIKLDIADVEYEVRGWKADFKNNISDLSEITGLKHLKNLTHLNISNNQIKYIEDLINLKNLTHLYASNNLITDIKNLDYIKKMKNLKYLDLAGNRLADDLTKQDFVSLEVNLKKSFY